MDIKIKKVSLPRLEIPRIYNMYQTGALCAEDIIAHIRGQVEKDPWVPVVIETTMKPIAEEELAAVRIYWAGVNDDQISTFASLSINTCQVVHFSELSLEEEDCGIDAIMDKFREEYHIQRFNVLITGAENEPGATEAISKLRSFILETGRDDVLFPYFIVSKSELLSTGLDISVAAKQLETLADKNSLTSVKLKEILADLESQIDPKTTVLQVLDVRRSVYSRLLSTYLGLKYNLPPLYVSPFISEYISFRAVYPKDKLSLYERLMFLKRLPVTVGLISQGQNFTCVAQVNKRIYPFPHTVFNITDNCIEADPSEFSFDDPSLHVGDYRDMFPQSRVMLNPDIPEGRSLIEAGMTDEEVDRNLSKMFVELAASSGEIVGISIKNSVMAKRNGKQYVIYCPEECGLQLGMVSNYIGALVHVISESEFHRLIDVQLAMAIIRGGDGKSMGVKDTRNSTELSTIWRQFDTRVALQPALPLDVWLYMQLLPFASNGLSYYDKYLRCSKDVLPITITEENGKNELSPILQAIPESPLRTGDGARFAVNAFGTIANYVEHNPVLRVTYDAFRQEALL